jgi:hypothetical protein
MDLFSGILDDVQIQKNSDEGRHYKDPDDETITLATAGAMWCVYPTIELKGYAEYILEAKFDYERNNGNYTEYRHKSRVGLWVPIRDHETRDRIGSYHYAVNDIPAIQVDVKNWEFGKIGKLKLINTGRKESAVLLPISVCAVPFFNRDDDFCELKITLWGKNEHTGNHDILRENTINFRIDENRPIESDENINLLNKGSGWGVFANTGTGNCIHPKQIITLRSLEHALGQFKEKKDLKIAYIGPDTTENLRAVIRHLKLHSNGKVARLTVYYTPEWDDHWVQEFTNMHPIDNINIGEIEYNFKSLSEKDDGLDVEPHDITICTYVSPWIQAKDYSTHKARIDRLLHGEDSILLSIDPEDSGSIVRNAISGRINLDLLYKQILKLKSSKIHTAKGKNQKGLLWRKRD